MRKRLRLCDLCTAVRQRRSLSRGILGREKAQKAQKSEVSDASPIFLRSLRLFAAILSSLDLVAAAPRCVLLRLKCFFQGEWFRLRTLGIRDREPHQHQSEAKGVTKADTTSAVG